MGISLPLTPPTPPTTPVIPALQPLPQPGAAPPAPVSLAAMVERGLPDTMIDVAYMASLIEPKVWAHALLMDVLYGPFSSTDWMVWAGGVVQVIRTHPPRLYPAPPPAGPVRIRAGLLTSPWRNTNVTSSSGGQAASPDHAAQDMLALLGAVQEGMAARRAEVRGVLDRLHQDGLDLDPLVAAASSVIMGRLHDHPVLKKVRERRTAARELWVGDVGDAARQTITLDDARALHAHFEELRARHHDGWKVPPLGLIVPGRHWLTVYGVQVVIEDRAPVLGKYEPRPGPGRVRSLGEIAREMLPAGTRLDRKCRMHVLAAPRQGRLVEKAKEWVAKALDAPHYIAVLSAEDLPECEYPPSPWSDEPGWLEVYGFTAAAIPASTPFIVYRPGPGLSAGWLHPDREGEWHERGHIHDLAHLGGVGPFSWSPLDAQVEVRALTARATGRVEIRDGQAAEVFEVTW
ncbi:hypothetical protein [Nonomuraea sp. NPDC003214]